MRPEKEKAAGAGTHGGLNNNSCVHKRTPRKDHTQDRKRIAATLNFFATLDGQRRKAVRS